MPALANVLYFILLHTVANRREPDQVIMRHDGVYLRRWWLFGRVRDETGEWIARRPFGRCVFLHQFVQSDEDKALHDHPWRWVSFLLHNCYWEHLEEYNQRVVLRQAGELRTSAAATRHRIELVKDRDGNEQPVWSLFYMAAWERDWGFWCKGKWVFWRDFEDKGGCE